MCPNFRWRVAALHTLIAMMSVIFASTASAGEPNQLTADSPRRRTDGLYLLGETLVMPAILRTADARLNLSLAARRAPASPPSARRGPVRQEQRPRSIADRLHSKELEELAPLVDTLVRSLSR